MSGSNNSGLKNFRFQAVEQSGCKTSGHGIQGKRSEYAERANEAGSNQMNELT